MASSSRLCRTCLTHEGEGEHIPIFEDGNDLSDRIFLCSGVKVCENFFLFVIHE